MRGGSRNIIAAAPPQMDLDARISTGGPQMGSARAAELVERLSGALQRQHLNLDEEQGLLEALLDITAVQGNPDEHINFAAQDFLPLDEQGWTLLVTYTFERRYGWSESADCNNDRAMDSLDNRAKKKINESLEQVINSTIALTASVLGSAAICLSLPVCSLHLRVCLLLTCVRRVGAALGMAEGAAA